MAHDHALADTPPPLYCHHRCRCGLPLLPIAARAVPPPLLRVWTGDALGADATLQIHHPDPTAADRLIARALAEVRRLEARDEPV